jgi:tetratricopeptide (TPR) repeat protein
MKRLFGQSPEQRESVRVPRTGRPETFERPFDAVSDGLQAWEAKDFDRAERLLREGVEEYRPREPADVHFALGRLGAFLLQQERTDEAAEVLEEAIGMGTDIPAISFDYMEVMARRRDVDGLFKAASRLATATGLGGVSSDAPWEALLGHARRASRAGDSAFGGAVALRVVDLTKERGASAAHWSAVGDLGEIRERAGELDEAMTLWQAAFDEGSPDPTTANRLSMHLERRKEYPRAVVVIEEALRRKMPANVEEQLRKRLERCRSRTERRTRGDVAAFSIREGQGAFNLLFQLRVSPPIRELAILDRMARAYCVSKGEGSLIDLAMADGAELGRQPSLPAFTQARFTPSGWGLGTARTARIGEGPTQLWFVSPGAEVVGTGQVPDATSQMAAGHDAWYVGCRDGGLYAFGFDGKARWRWETPGTNSSGDAYSRPCPYYVTWTGEQVVVSSMGDVYGITPAGRTAWHFELPSEPKTYTLSVPGGDGLSSQEAREELGVNRDATADEVKGAYRRRAMATHPDQHPGDRGAAARFRKVHAAYETLMRAGSHEDDEPILAVTITMADFSPTVSHLAPAAGRVFVGTSDGKLFEIDASGRVQGMHALGEGWARPVVSREGSLAAAWCDGLLFYLEHDELRSFAEFEEPPKDIGLLGKDLFIWNRNRLEVVDRSGHPLWVAEFSKAITNVATDGDRLFCAAGVLTAFERTA